MPETPQNSGNKHPEKDRRLHARQRIHSLSYVKIGEGNGGIVLNISEGGISVQAAGVLDDSEILPLWLEIPKLRERVEVKGEIAWLSPSRKEAGLRFVDLPESTLREIQKWMAREAAPEKFEDETDPADGQQKVPVPAVEPTETLAREPLAADAANEVDGGEGEAEPESAEELAKSEDEEQEVEKAEDPTLETETEIDEEPEIEEAAAAKAETDSPRRDELSVEQSETDHETEAAVEEEEEAVAAEEAEVEETHETEDDLIKAFGPPVVPFERRPHTPFSSMSAISGGTRAAQNLAIAPPVSHIFAEPPAPAPATSASAAQSGSNSIRVQMQTGWFLAALVLLLALISFIAGMAVRRGALNGVMGEQEDSLAPKSAPAAGASTAPVSSPGGGSANADVTPAHPMSIEIVDLANRRWVIPASTGVNHAIAAGSPGSTNPPSNAAGDSETAPTATGTSVQPQISSQASGQAPANASSASGTGASGTGGPKPNLPLVLSLPETPISASGSVAISSQRSVPVPPDGNQSGKSARNLQVGQLVNLVEPVYPPEAVQQKIEGTVKLHAVIGTDGVIESLAQVSGPQILVNASMAAVRNWKYSPTRMNGQAIETQEDISFVFRLPD